MFNRPDNILIEGGRNGHHHADPVAKALHPSMQAGRELLGLGLLCLLSELLVISGWRLHLALM